MDEKWLRFGIFRLTKESTLFDIQKKNCVLFLRFEIGCVISLYLTDYKLNYILSKESYTFLFQTKMIK